MCLDVNHWAFKYQDSEYFKWFSARRNTQDLFGKILKWKGLHRRINTGQDWRDWNNGNCDAYRLVTRVFLAHLRNPIKFPILDKNVWREYRQLTGGIDQNGKRIVINPEDWQRHYLDGYKNFFDARYCQEQNNINFLEINGVDQEIVKRRILDRALWEYGRTVQ